MVSKYIIHCPLTNSAASNNFIIDSPSNMVCYSNVAEVYTVFWQYIHEVCWCN